MDGHDPADPHADDTSIDTTALALAELMARRRGGRLVACAESFTAGLLCQTMAAVEGSGDWFAGGVVAYRTEQKRSVLGVCATRAISEGCAVQMALGAAKLFGTTAAVATTGVAGPTEQEGHEPGTIIIGWVVDGEYGTTSLSLPGRPEEIIQRGVRTALTALSRAMTDADDPPSI